MVDSPAMDERDLEPRVPMKRLGSTRKLAAFTNIRLQLAEQSRVLEARAEAAAGVASELHEYCRRRADLEHEYSRSLEKLARAATNKHDAHRHKREQWSLTGAFGCWQAALEGTRALSRDHAALADLYGGPLAGRLQRAADDVLRLHRKCRDIVNERHEELGNALAEAAAAGKAHAAAAAEWRASALKLRHAYEQRARLASTEPPRLKKLKALDKDLDKRRTRHSEARARALRARADYVLSLEAANATLQRFYLDDIADIILCAEVGFEAVVGRAARCAGAAETARGVAAGEAGATVRAAADALDALGDRRRLLDAHASAFAPPRPLPYRGAPPDRQDAEMREAAGGAADDRDDETERARTELAHRLTQMESAARRLRAECRESAKTLDAAEAELVRLMEGPNAIWDVSRMFGSSAAGASSTQLQQTDDGEATRRDQEDYYLAKFRAYVSCAGRLARLETKATAVRGRLLPAIGGDEGGTSPPAPPPATPPTPPRRAAARLRRGQFAAPLDHRLPVVLTSCVRVIATYGLKHQGIFRVSGSQVEMQSLRAAFERGEDPLAHVRDASDINSVCGLLKLYLREVRPPLVPPQLQERLLRIAALPDDSEFVRRLRDTLAPLPLPALIVLRYLFAFLSHLTEYSDHNMMDAWNLAICVGPTLLAAWGEGGAQVTAQNLVNELVKRTILHHRDVFPQDVAPYALYVRFMEGDGEGDGDADSEPRDDTSLGGGDGSTQVPTAPDDLSLYEDEADGDECDGPEGTLSADETSDECEPNEWGPTDDSLIMQCTTRCDVDADGDHQLKDPDLEGIDSIHAAEDISKEVTSVDSGTSVGPPACRRLADTTPDLVLDLPLRAPAPSPAVNTCAPVGPNDVTDAADTFLQNRDTLKKKQPNKKSQRPEAESVTAEREPAGGSPVPARNTARVAAKFAELTLTGGSLKPALAAKPALLRRTAPPHSVPSTSAPPSAPGTTD